MNPSQVNESCVPRKAYISLGEHPELLPECGNFTPIHLDENSLMIYSKWVPIIKITSEIGYWTSNLFLIISVIIYSSFRKLRGPKSKLHIHLFLSFIIRATTYIIKQHLFVDGVGLSPDLDYEWTICRFIISVQNYSILANYMFVLMEGIYLHNLIFNAFAINGNVKSYLMSGWGIPLIITLIWALLRMIFENSMCWTISQNKYCNVVIHSPIAISILVNFVCFIRIVITLYGKINCMFTQQRYMKYRKLTTSTFTLVHLLGTPYTVSLILKFIVINDNTLWNLEIIWICFDQVFTAFQGCITAFLFCLLHKSVHQEIIRKIHSKMERGASKKTEQILFSTRANRDRQKNPPILQLDSRF